jgi:hypothetical protein
VFVICFLNLSERVMYMGSLSRHASKCFKNQDSKSYEKPAMYRDPPPKPPEHVYARVSRTTETKQSPVGSSLPLQLPESEHVEDMQSGGAGLEEEEVVATLRQEATLRSTINRYKAGHTFQSSIVSLTFICFPINFFVPTLVHFLKSLF